MNKEFRDADEYCNRPDQQGFRQSYIPSGHVGLFERYGYSYVTEITNYGGECEHLFVKRI